MDLKSQTLLQMLQTYSGRKVTRTGVKFYFRSALFKFGGSILGSLNASRFLFLLFFVI